MIADFGDQIGAFADATTVTLRRRAAGSSAYGIFTPGAEASSTIVAAVVHGLETQELLPQSERTGEIITLFTATRLFSTRAPAGTTADRIGYDGETYEVRGVRNWAGHGNFYEAAAVKVAQ